jgi:hypothetical protein
MLRGFSELLLRAWCQSEGPVRLQMEAVALQPLLHVAVYGQHAPTVQNARRMLRHWLDQRKLKGVDDLLSRLFQPILWVSGLPFSLVFSIILVPDLWTCRRCCFTAWTQGCTSARSFSGSIRACHL